MIDLTNIDKFYTAYPEQLDLPKDFDGTIITEGDFTFVIFKNQSVDIWEGSEAHQTVINQGNFDSIDLALEAIQDWC